MRKFGLGKLLSLLLLLTMLVGGCTAEEQPSQAAKSSSAGSSISLGQESQDDTEPLAFQDEELGITFTLPELLRDHTKITTTRNEADTVTSVMGYYMRQPDDTENDIHIFTIDLMSVADWEALQAEGGPTGLELGRSADGRVAIYSSLQSNPLAEDDELYDFFQTLPGELDTVIESFAFLEEDKAD